MKVRALKDGFIGGSRRRAGAVFDVPDSTKLGTWLERLDAPAAEPRRTPKSAAPVKADDLT